MLGKREVSLQAASRERPTRHQGVHPLARTSEDRATSWSLKMPSTRDSSDAGLSLLFGGGGASFAQDSEGGGRTSAVEAAAPPPAAACCSSTVESFLRPSTTYTMDADAAEKLSGRTNLAAEPAAVAAASPSEVRAAALLRHSAGLRNVDVEGEAVEEDKKDEAVEGRGA